MDDARILRFLLRTAAAVTVSLALFAAALGTPARAQTPAAGITIRAQQVYRGCNDLVVQAPAGTSWTSIISHFSDPTTVLGMWRFDNPTQRYQALYFKNAAAPLDGPPSSTAPTFAIWACIGANGSIS